VSRRLALLAVPRCAAAEAPRTVAVLSLIGDEMSLVTRRTPPAAAVDRNDRQAIALADPSFDLAAALAAERRDQGGDARRRAAAR
jgi:hypothetical protein